MKTLSGCIIFASLLEATAQQAAKTNAPAVTEQMAKARAEFIREHKAMRVINGKLYDFTPIITDSIDLLGFQSVLVKGKVTQVLTDGLLIRLTESNLPIHLRNFPDQDAMIDGAPLRALALVCGRYQYASTQGATVTIVDYDCGHTLDATKEKFTQKTIVTHREQIEIDIPELDKKALEILARSPKTKV